MKSCGCREHWRTSENAQDEILRNSSSPLGPNPEVHVENFPYIRQRKTIVRPQQKFLICCPHCIPLIIMPSTPQLLPAKLCQQVEEMKRAGEAWEKEEHEREAVLLRVAEEEEKQEAERKQQEEEERKWQAEATLEVERELWEQGWQLDELLEEFWQHQLREEKQKEVDMEVQGPCLGCQSRKIECVRE